MSAISKSKTIEVAEHHVVQENRLSTARSALLKAMQATAEEVRAVRQALRSWALKTKVGGIWSARLEEKAYSSPQASKAHQPTSFPCPRCGLTLHLKGEGTHAIIYDIADWERQCQNGHLRNLLNMTRRWPMAAVTIVAVFQLFERLPGVDIARFSPHFPSSGRKSTAREIEIGQRGARTLVRRFW